MEYIAHIRNEDKAIQTVQEHLVNVGNLASQYGEKIGVKNLAALSGLLHDMGKFSCEFRDYILKAVYDPVNAPSKGSVDHSTAGGKYIYDLLHTSSSDPLEKMVSEIIGNIIISHHMGLQDFLDHDSNSAYLRRVEEKEVREYDEMISLLHTLTENEEMIKSYIQKSKVELLTVLKKATSSQKKVPITLTFITKFIFSCLIDADRTDTRLFEEDAQPPQEKNHQEIFKEYYNRLLTHLEQFNTNCNANNRIHKLRGDMSKKCDMFAEKSSGIYTLSIPTGGGKTLASLRYALKHATRYNKERIIYIVPYTTIIEQNAEEVRKILMAEENILEHHSNITEDIEDTEDNYVRNKTLRLAKDNWDSPIIFTTMVQFLDNFYSKGTRNVRRLHNLANSIIIFDEVQSVPVKCVSLFNEAINFLKNVCNTSILLCTATQPALDFVERKIEQIDGEIIENLNEITSAFKRVEFFDKTTPKGWDTEELANFIENELVSKTSLLCILNTKTVVRRLYERLKNDQQMNIYHLSTSMCAAHRKEVLDEVKIKLLKGEKVICLSTQLIEAGVDISFGCVIRSLAGLDSIAQAAGRCNRHGEQSIGQVYIIKHNEEHLTKLKSIKVGAEITYKLLADRKKEQNLLNNETLNHYFKQYYHELKEELKYYVPELNGNLIDLLEDKYRQAYKNKTCEEFPLLLASSMKTAAKYFQVIDQQTTSVIVPYGEGSEIIADLNGSLSIDEMTKIFKKAQHFTIGIYPHEKDVLMKNGDLIPLREGQFLALRENAYDKNYGLMLSGEGEMNTLFC